MSVKSHTATSEVALREAPSISEHQHELGKQIGELRKRLNDYLFAEEGSKLTNEEQSVLHKE